MALDWKQLDETSLATILSTDGGLKSVLDLRDEDAIAVADVLDRALKSPAMRSSRRREFRAVLRRLCGRSGILPSSLNLSAALLKVTDHPVSAGGFADVWTGQYKGRPVAIKSLRIYHQSSDVPAIRKRFYKEVLVWERLRHPNVLPFLGVSSILGPFCMVSPWMPHGNIVEYVNAHPDANRILLLTDTANGLKYLHSEDAVHGDLKGVNVLINNDYRACIADFGLTVAMSDTLTAFSQTTTTNMGGTIRWMAPELLAPEEFGKTKSSLTKESDIYALGMVILEVMTGKVPFSSVSNMVVAVRVINGGRPARPEGTAMSDTIWRVIEECWRPNLNERPHINQVLDALIQECQHWYPMDANYDVDYEVLQSLGSPDDSPRLLGIPFLDEPHSPVIQDEEASIVPSSSPSSTPVNSVETGSATITVNDWLQLDEDTLHTRLANREGFNSVLSLEGPDAIAFADMLDQTLRLSTVEKRRRKKYTVTLRKLCGKRGILPTSHTLPEGVEKTGNSPHAAGHFGEVWQGRYKGDPVAIKALKVLANDDITKIQKRFCKEAVVWKSLCHPNVLSFLGVHVSIPISRDTSPSFWMVSQWMPNGTIVDYLKKHPDENRVALLVQIAEGLEYLQAMDLVHGDLKGANILVNDKGQACLADFGLMDVMADSITGLSATTAGTGGTTRWMAPELLSSQYRPTHRRPSKESDIYALGMVIYEVMTGSVPFRQLIFPDMVIAEVLSGRRPERPMHIVTFGLSDEVWELMQQCWHQLWDERPLVHRVVELLKEASQSWLPSTRETTVTDVDYESDASSGVPDSFFASN